MVFRGLVLLVVLLQPALAQSVVFVKHDATGAGSGSSWTDAFTDLQQALQATEAPAEIWVAAGTYKPTSGTDRTASFLMRSGIALYGGFVGWEKERDQRDWTLNETILSGELGNPHDDRDNSCHVLRATGADSTAVLDGFTVARGYARACIDARGGGLFVTSGSVTVRHSVFRNNLAGAGGAIYFNPGSHGHISDSLLDANRSVSGGGAIACRGSSPLLERATFRGNEASTVGGGLMNWQGSHPVCIDCVFENNRGYEGGGGLYNQTSRPRLLRAVFTGNTSQWGGGAIETEISSHMVCIGCHFENNRTTGVSAAGGAIYISEANPVFINSVFQNNRATFRGGAVLAWQNSQPHFINSIFSGNRAPGGGAFALIGSPARLTNVTVAGNRATLGGGGFWIEGGGTTMVRNSIVWDNRLTSGEPSQIHLDGSTVMLSDGIMQGECDGHVICQAIAYEDPLLVRLPVWSGTTLVDAGDLRLQEGSPAIDAGNLEHLPPDVYDLDGDGDTSEPLPVDLLWNPRVQGRGVDFGAYEGPVAVSVDAASVPDVGSGVLVYPNPVRGAAVVVIDLPRPGPLVVEVFDLLGRRVLALQDGAASGRYVAVLEAERLPAGVYVLKATGEGVSESRRLTIVR